MLILIHILVILGIFDLLFDIYNRIEREVMRKLAIKQLKSGCKQLRAQLKVFKPLLKIFGNGLKSGFNKGDSEDK